jgi:hypothetical protein
VSPADERHSPYTIWNYRFAKRSELANLGEATMTVPSGRCLKTAEPTGQVISSGLRLTADET